MRGCQFEGDSANPCPMPMDIGPADIRKPCDQDYGSNCAGLVGQKLVAATFTPGSAQSSLDTGMGLITHFARVTELPAGEAPEAIRESLIDMSFPLRKHRPRRDVNINHIDFIATLLNSGKLREANWYNRYSAQQAQRTGKAVLWWTFQSQEAEVTKLAEPRKTLNHFDYSFKKGHPALWNSHVPPMVEVRHAIDGSGVSRSVPIELPMTPPKRGLLRRFAN